MNLGTLIDTLEGLPPTLDVKFDNGKYPQKLVSWRGVYAELSLDSSLFVGGEPERMTVRRLLLLAKKADGGTFQGYRGGEYTMGRHTPVWADDYGGCNYRGIMDVAVVGGVVRLQTADLSDYR